MSAELSVLVVAAASMGFIHTIVGPDHYLPFVMMSLARKWSSLKTAVITLLCGLGHIASSVVLGLLGVWLGLAASKLEEQVQSFRGSLAAWLLTAFGLAYMVWGLRQAYRGRLHVHGHVHADELSHVHTHMHSHDPEHTHVHNGGAVTGIAPWVLFVIFVFGPCETLIPLVIYPSAQHGFWGVLVVTMAFGSATIVTMLALVQLSLAGVSFLPLRKLQRFSHLIAGATILLCGLAILFLGL